MSENLFRTLKEACSEADEKEFLSSPFDGSVSYADFFNLAGKYASALQSCGVEEGDRVLVKTEKSAGALALYMGCLQLGAIYVPVNPASTAHEINFFVSDAEPALAVFDANEQTSVGVRSESIGPGGSLTSIMSSMASKDSSSDRGGTDVASMLYTSGTTGRPKGAMLSHRALIANGVALNKIWGFEPDDVLLHCLPIFHVHGLFVAVHCAMLSGSKIIFLNKFSVTEVLESLPKSTVLMGVPTYYSRLLSSEDFDSSVCSEMRLFTSGSAPMTEQTHAAFHSRTGSRILERYGMTEAGIISSNPLNGDRVPGSVGFALPGMEIRVASDGRLCEANENGVVEVKGDHLFNGYWRQPEQTSDALRDDGFLITGDVGNLDKDGRLRLEGRSTDLIISGGENIYPKEIELCLDSFNEITESAVIGVPHHDLGEAVVAVVVTNEYFSLPKLKDYVELNLANFKQPKEYLLVSELPRNTMGKVQKSKLRNSYTALFERNNESH
ncbi:MAG: AMP-binding protein [Acidimicrobiales bacterium]|jgi:malonyl-CoA/methylmalonyl-CoA synthetase|nr:AMP-binding protein [Acidimicrobiales bacterium]MDP6298411.1 AMP-binding protein [Acidimicrobiales bacterium]HJM27536.1 AMP-binding protein [Acidimicrobiales bacterium]HJM98095.1 AMP-binding protein [Acidimicrobiales bacterium]